MDAESKDGEESRKRTREEEVKDLIHEEQERMFEEAVQKLKKRRKSEPDVQTFLDFHKWDEAKAIRLGYKSRICQFFEKGTCHKGQLCPYAHGKVELLEVKPAKEVVNAALSMPQAPAPRVSVPALDQASAMQAFAGGFGAMGMASFPPGAAIAGAMVAHMGFTGINTCVSATPGQLPLPSALSSQIPAPPGIPPPPLAVPHARLASAALPTAVLPSAALPASALPAAGLANALQTAASGLPAAPAMPTAALQNTTAVGLPTVTAMPATALQTTAAGLPAVSVLPAGAPSVRVGGATSSSSRKPKGMRCALFPRGLCRLGDLCPWTHGTGEMMPPMASSGSTSASAAVTGSSPSSGQGEGPGRMAEPAALRSAAQSVPTASSPAAAFAGPDVRQSIEGLLIDSPVTLAHLEAMAGLTAPAQAPSAQAPEVPGLAVTGEYRAGMEAMLENMQKLVSAPVALQFSGSGPNP